jgi:hypothetical protein
MRLRLRQPFTALPLGALLLALLAVVSLLLAGCGSSGSDAEVSTGGEGEGDGATTTTVAEPEPEPEAGELPADQIVFQAQTGGGYVPMQAAATEIPFVTIYGDGRVFVTDGQADRPYDVGPTLLTTTVDAAALEAFLADATGSGLFVADADFGQPMVTDLPTTTVTLHTDDPAGAVSVSAYALGFDSAPGGGLDDEQIARRQELSTIVDAAQALGDGGEEWTPDRVRATAYDPEQTQLEGTIEPAEWPGPAFSTFPEPTPAGAVSSCLVLEGDEAAAVWAAASGRTNSWWVVGQGDQQARQIVVVPLVPGAEGCPPA